MVGRKEKARKSLIYGLLSNFDLSISGDGGIRTLVQNRETLRLLHAYPRLDFRARQGSRRTRVLALGARVSLDFRTTIPTSTDLRHPGAQPSVRRLEG